MIRALQLLFFIFLLSSCATGGRESRKKLLNLVQTEKYAKALKHIETDKFFKDKDSKLLYLLEKGMVLHRKGDYLASSIELEKAKGLLEKLYTKSLSKKASTLLVNENVDIYYGEKYEHSMLYFYLALNYYLDYLKDYKRENLFRARATLLAWESFQSELKDERGGASVFKYDLLSRLFGAFIHEEVNSPADRQIAKTLYRDANQILLKNYNSYPSFNEKFKEFNQNYEKLSRMDLSKVRKNYVEKTKHQLAVRKFIRKKKKGNTLFVYQEKFIPRKYAKKEYYGLGKSISNNSAGARVGAAILGHFAANILGLYPTPGSYNPVGYQVGYEVGRAAVSLAAISFELPAISDFKAPEKRALIIENSKGKLLRRSEFFLVNPMGEIARQAISENSRALYVKLGARLATKHVTAILASYATYRAIKPKGEFFAKNAAVVQYLALSKGIEMSESADTRSWSTLPENIHLTRLNLKNGKYVVKVMDGTRVVKEKSIVLKQKARRKMILL